MNKTTHVILAALLLLAALPVLAGDKNVGPAKNKPVVVNVGGHVNRPGPTEYKNNATIFSMILAAGGPTRFGTLRRVKVSRGGKNFELDLTQQKLKDQEFAEPGDAIEVPQMNLLGR